MTFVHSQSFGYLQEKVSKIRSREDIIKTISMDSSFQNIPGQLVSGVIVRRHNPVGEDGLPRDGERGRQARR